MQSLQQNQAPNSAIARSVALRQSGNQSAALATTKRQTKAGTGRRQARAMTEVEAWLRGELEEEEKEDGGGGRACGA